MVAVVAAVATSHNLEPEEGHNIPICTFKLGTLVNIQSRTWPGINKPGGVGTVVAFDAKEFSIDVKYSLGGGEKGVSLEYVQEHKFEGDDSGGGNGRGRRRHSREKNTVVAKMKATVTETENKPKSKRGQRQRALKDASTHVNNEMNKDEKVQSKLSSAKKTGAKRKSRPREVVTVEKNVKKKKQALTVTKSKTDKVEVMVKAVKTKTETPAKDVLARARKARPTVTSYLTEDRKADVSKNKKGNMFKSNKPNVTTKKAQSRKQAEKEMKEPEPKLKESDGSYIHTGKIQTSLKRAPVPSLSAAVARLSTSTETVSSSATSNTTSNRWKIKSPTNVLKNVYKGIKTQASSFVQEMVVGKKDSSVPSSPESTSSLEIQMERGRESEFDALFSAIMRQKMLEAIELEDLVKEIEKRAKDKTFTALEVKQHLERLDQNNRVMVSSGSIYML